ncbi:MAG: amino acid adenylation domain-containing protein [Gordonia sp. (in: high G+C Gram-positive bacteria)]
MLVISAHPLLVDAAGRRLLARDLAAAWEAVATGAPLELSTADDPEELLNRCGERALDADVVERLDAWRALAARAVPPAPAADPRTGTAPGLDPDAFRAVGLDAVGTGLAVAGLALGLARAERTAADSAATDSSALVVDLVRDGRDDLACGGADSTLPLGTAVPTELWTGTDPVQALARTREVLAPPAAGFGLLEYLHPQAGPVLTALPPAFTVRVDDARGLTLLTEGETAAELAVALHDDGLTATVTAEDVAGVDAEAFLAALPRAAALLASAAADPANRPGPGLDDLVAVDLAEADLRTLQTRIARPLTAVWGLSPLQEGLYFQSAVSGDLDVYNAQFVLSFDRALDPGRLRRALAALMAEHPPLRSGFAHDGLPAPVQFIVDGLTPPLEVVDLRVLTGEALAEAEAQIVEADKVRRFELDTPPLWRATLLRRADGDRLVVSRRFLVWDGWSNGVFIGGLLAHYAGTAPDREAAAEPAFARYLRWLAARDRDAALAAWSRYLDGYDEPALLRPGADPVVRGGTRVVKRSLTEAQSQGLGATAQRVGVTLNTVLSTALLLVTGRWSGRTDVVIGQTVAGRPTEVDGADAAIGMFLNTVPVRARLRPDAPVGEFLRAQQSDRLDLLGHEWLSLGEIAAAVRTPALFDVLLVLQNFIDDGRLGAEHGVVGHDSEDHTHFALTVVVTPGRELAVTVETRRDLVDDVTAAGLVDDLFALLEAFSGTDGEPATPDAGPLEDLPLAALPITAAEPPQAGRDLDVPELSVSEMLAVTAAAHADAPALVFGDTTLTFGALDAEINRLARLLLAQGAGPETVVALAIERSIEMVVALFAVLRTGAAYLPLELVHPAERLRGLVDDARPVVALTAGADDEALAHIFADGPSPVRLRDPEVRARLDALPAGPLDDAELGLFASDRPGRLDHPAYLIYTSGSTGKPKGVVTGYRGLTNMYLNHEDEIFRPSVALSKYERLTVAHTVSFAFDMSWEELLWLTYGHTVHVCDENLRRDPEALVAYCDRWHVDVVNVTPTYAEYLIGAGLLDDEGHAPALVLLGGEAVGTGVWDALTEAPGTLGYNLYGPTEYTINTLGGGTVDSPTPTVGRPISNTVVHLLDPWLRPVPPGVAGELYVEGDGLARGYHDRPELTALSFVAHPSDPGRRLYRTGDLMRRRADGLLDYLGRTDYQVKVRGYRVEPSEIEAALTAIDGIALAVVAPRTSDTTAHGGQRGTTTLAAYLVADPEAPAPSNEQVRRTLSEALPAYMVPSSFTWIDEIPVNVNGKRDLKALPEPAAETADGGRAGSLLERVLAELAAETFGLETVDVDANLFDLGAHSLQLMTFADAVRSRLDVDLAVSQVFADPSIAAIAAVLDGDPAAADRLKTPVIEFRVAGPAPTVVVLPPGTGLGWPFGQLLPYIPVERGVYAVQAPQISGSPVPEELPDVVRYFADRVDDAVPGPLVLFGWSYGGSLAPAVAAELTARGRTVESLVLLDAFAESPAEYYAYLDTLSPNASALGALGIPVPPERSGDLRRDEAIDLVLGGESFFAGLDPAVVDAVITSSGWSLQVMRRHAHATDAARPARAVRRGRSGRLPGDLGFGVHPRGVPRRRPDPRRTARPGCRGRLGTGADRVPGGSGDERRLGRRRLVNLDSSTPIELTMSQAALWFGQTLDPENPTFNVCDAVELTGGVDVDLLVRAAHLAATESDALTTRLVETDGGVRQIPGAFDLAPPEVVDLAPGEAWRRLADHVRGWTGHAHDLRVEPGVHQWILRHGDTVFWVLAAHHALIDAYGLSLVFTRGAEIYRRLCAGEPDVGRPLGSIRDVVDQDLAYLGSPKARADAEFWTEQVAAADTTEAAGQARSVRSVRRSIAPVTNPADPTGPSNWAAVVTAAVAAFLARRTGRQSQTMGFLLMNRLGLAAARVPTSAVNLTPLTVRTAPGDRVRDVIGNTQDTMRALSAHQRYRGGAVPGAEPTLTSGFTRHVGTVVNVKPFATTLDFAGLPAVVHSVDRGPVQDFSVTVAMGGDGRPELILDADAHEYGAEALDELLDELSTFIEEFTAADADRALASFDLLTEAQRAAVVALGDGGANPEGETSVLELFDTTVSAHPETTAIVGHDDTLTFGDLAARADRIGAVLRAQGVGPEELVAVVAETSALALSGILGIWRAGGAYVPIDPKYPADRIAHQLSDSAPRVVLVTPESRGVVEGLLPEDAVVLDLTDLPDPAPVPRGAEGPVRHPRPDATAYVIYTSGSTGLPKGVMISHRAIATLLGSHRYFTMKRPGQRLLSTHTLSFDSSVSNIAWLCAGHEIHLIDRADVTDAALVVDYVRRRRIDYVDAVPVLIDAYVRAGLTEVAPDRHVPEYLSTGGEAFPPALWSELTDRTDVTVFNLYGPTEATVEITFTEVSDTPLPSIGVPSRGSVLHVLDRHLRPVAEGRVGELYLTTPQLARGYLGRGDLTSQRFVANPFGDGGRMYRTGDLVRWNAHGRLDYLGRSDDQVQIAGYRVEFGEVEALLARAARAAGLAVDQIVADVRSSRTGARRLVAYLSGTEGDDFSALRAATVEIAPAHLVPGVFVPVADIPLSPSGKTDRAALPDPWAQRTAPVVTAEDSPEAVLCGIVADLLDLDEVSADDDFFSLGGDSIIAIQVTSRARAAGLSLTPRQVFELRTPRALAEQAVHGARPPATTTDPARAYGDMPLTPLMKRVLRGGRLGGFAQARVLRVPVGADLALLDEALSAVVDAHPMLGAVLTSDGMTVAPPTEAGAAVEIAEHVLPSGLDADRADDRITELAAEAARGLDPEVGPPVRALLVRGLPAGDCDALVLVVHHLVMDGVSWRILIEDLRTAYDRVAAARAAQIEAEGTSFREWAGALVDRAVDDDVLAGRPYWEHPTGGPDEIRVGTRPLDAETDTAARVERIEVDVPADAVLSRLPNLYRTGPTEVLLATLAVAIGAVSAEGDRRRLFVDLEGHGRDETLVEGADLSRTLGWFTAFWPVPIDLPPTVAEASAETVDATIKQVKELLARPQFSGLEYGLLTELHPDARPQAPSPVLFNYLGRLTTGEGDSLFSSLWPGRPLLVLRDDDMPASHPLEFNAVTVPSASGDVLRTEVAWVRTLVDDGRVRAVLEKWSEILHALSDETVLDSLGGLTPSDSLVDDLTQDEIEEFAGEFA